MGYISTGTGRMTLAPSPARALMLQQRSGLGDMSTDMLSTDLLSSLSSSDTLTGLPILWEIGLGLLGAALLMSWGKKTTGKVRRYSRQRKARSVRKAQLKAELAAL
jgi:hypothetical protein